VRRKSLIGSTFGLFSACGTVIDRPTAPGMDHSTIAHLSCRPLAFSPRNDAELHK
jgi:hypothetical protein